MAQEKELKEQLSNATNLIEDMNEHRSPIASEAGRFNAFMKQVLLKAINFATYEPTESAGSRSRAARKVYGEEAVDMKWPACASRTTPQEPGDLKLFRTYR